MRKRVIAREVTGIYRKLRKEDARHWLGSALRHTWLPAVVRALRN
jgi:hypothetical protein